MLSIKRVTRDILKLNFRRMVFFSTITWKKSFPDVTRAVLS